MTTETASIDDLSRSAEEADGDDLFVVGVDGFEGPLHLLLELARRQKVDLAKISIVELAEQYLEFVQSEQRRRIDLAADYLLMAAWLAFLKSKLLLPKPEKLEDDELSSEDMADALAFRLRRLEAMREAAKSLQAGPVLNNAVFLRGAPQHPKVVRIREYDTTTWHMTQAFGAIRARQEEDAPHVIEQQLVLPLEAARDELRHLIPDLEDWESLDGVRDRISDMTRGLPVRSVTASVFSAALELARDGDADLRQGDAFAPLYLRAALREIEGGDHGIA
ncbi:MAG: ScpA family protein [Pseudomonadota bacterium]